jgi:hypothetical protein
LTGIVRERGDWIGGETDEILQSRPDQQDRDGAEQATASDEREHLNRAFSHLPNEQREVIELSYFKGMNQQEISEHLNISLGTVKSRTRLGNCKTQKCPIYPPNMKVKRPTFLTRNLFCTSEFLNNLKNTSFINNIN